MVRNRRPSKQMIVLLNELLDSGHRWRHGYDLMKATGLLSGTLYPLLMRMSEQGLVEEEWLEPAPNGRLPRHAYRLTQKGAATAREILRPQPSGRLSELPA